MALQQSSYRGCLLGMAVGDAMGYTVDHRSWSEIQEDYGPNGLLGYDLVNGYADVTSYTQLAAFTCNGLLFGLTRGQMLGKMAPLVKYIGLSSKEWAASQRPWGRPDKSFCWLLQNRRLTAWSDKDRPEVAGEIRRGNHQVIYYISQFAPDSKTQMEWLQKAATQKNGAAMYALSSVTSRQDPPLSLKQLKAAVTLHDPSAMYVYGSFLVAEPGEYHKSTGLEQNVPLGVSMLQLSCMLGNSQSRRTLARAYYRGELGMPKDRSKTYAHLKWLNSAQKDHIALAAQGFMLLVGEGTKQDIETGKRYITLAANDGYSYALAMMAYAHYKGIGTTRDVQKAIDVLQEAAAAGFPHAYLYIAFLTAKGLHGESADTREAERYVNIAGLYLGNQAKVIFNELMKEEDWVLPPFPLEKQ